MNDKLNYDPTPEQQLVWVQEALIQDGFEKMSISSSNLSFYKEVRENVAIVVNLDDGKHDISFLAFGKRVDKDKDNFLGRIGTLIADAMTGILPTTTTSSEVVGDVPPVEEPTQHDYSVQNETEKMSNNGPSENASSDTQKPVKNINSAAESVKNDDSAVSNVPTVHEPAQALIPPTTSHGLLDLIARYVGNDVLQVFGETGSGKSKFGLEAAREAIAAGKKVYYLDTERNLTVDDINSLKGCQYKYTPVLDEIDKIVQNLPAVDVVILDSIGFPVLTTYARLSVKQKGDALLKLIAIFGDLKTWAYKHNGVAIVTNQPESEFNKPPGHDLRPFGDKSQYAAKEIWKTKIESRSQNQTNISLTAFRSRSVGFGTKIASMNISDSGVVIT